MCEHVALVWIGGSQSKGKHMVIFIIKNIWLTSMTSKYKYDMLHVSKGNACRPLILI